MAQNDISYHILQKYDFFSVNHNFSSAYSALSDTIGGHFWASKLLRTYRVIKVTIPTYICISC